jgi:hypothetical protein
MSFLPDTPAGGVRLEEQIADCQSQVVSVEAPQMLPKSTGSSSPSEPGRLTLPSPAQQSLGFNPERLGEAERGLAPSSPVPKRLELS